MTARIGSRRLGSRAISVLCGQVMAAFRSLSGNRCPEGFSIAPADIAGVDNRFMWRHVEGVLAGERA